MINRAIIAFILVHNRERGAGDGIANAQLFAKRFDERGFPRAHFAVKKEYAGAAGKVQDLFRCFW